jgi:hypothetical protein
VCRGEGGGGVGEAPGNEFGICSKRNPGSSHRRDGREREFRGQQSDDAAMMLARQTQFDAGDRLTGA